jgi:hypothetical protein
MNHPDVILFVDRHRRDVAECLAGRQLWKGGIEGEMRCRRDGDERSHGRHSAKNKNDGGGSVIDCHS